jgi:hypothetical protein
MAHLAPSWPEQTLCKENKRRALAEQQRRWMQQREEELHRSAPSEDAELDSITTFLDAVGESLREKEPARSSTPSSYEETNEMLRNLHLARRGHAAPVPTPSAAATPQLPSAAALTMPSAPPRAVHAVQPVRPSRRTPAQRAAAERLAQVPLTRPFERSSRGAAPATLLGAEDFYKHQQAKLQRYRTTYDARVGAHFDALAARTDVNLAAPVPTDAIGALAYQHASRHVAPISQLVCGASHNSQSSSMAGFTSGKTAGRRGGRVGRSGSILAAAPS